MASDYPGPKSLDDILAELRARYQGIGQGASDFQPWVPDTSPLSAPPLPTPGAAEPPGVMERAKQVLEEGSQWLDEKGDAALNYYANESLRNRMLAGEKVVPTRELAYSALGWDVNKPPESNLQAAAQGVTNQVLNLATPSNAAILAGVGVAAASYPVVGTVAGLGFGAVMAKDIYERAKAIYQRVSAEGWTPESTKDLTEATIEAGLIVGPMAAKKLMGRARGTVEAEPTPTAPTEATPTEPAPTGPTLVPMTPRQLERASAPEPIRYSKPVVTRLGPLGIAASLGKVQERLDNVAQRKRTLAAAQQAPDPMLRAEEIGLLNEQFFLEELQKKIAESQAKPAPVGTPSLGRGTYALDIWEQALKAGVKLLPGEEVRADELMDSFRRELDPPVDKKGYAPSPDFNQLHATEVLLIELYDQLKIGDRISKSPPALAPVAKMSGEAIDRMLEAVTRAIEIARRDGNTAKQAQFEARRLELLDAKANAATAPTPATPPAPGTTPPQTNFPTSGATALAPETADVTAPTEGGGAPGPRPGAGVVPAVPMEPTVPGGASPADAARARQQGMADDVQTLLDQGRDAAAGGPGEAPPPGVVVKGPSRGAGVGAIPTPPLPILPPAGALPPPAAPVPVPPPVLGSGVVAPPAPPPAPGAVAAPPTLAVPPAGIQPLNEEVVAFAGENAGQVDTSLLQRRFKVGYKQAKAWADELAAAGIAAPPQEPVAAPPVAEEPPAPAAAPQEGAPAPGSGLSTLGGAGRAISDNLYQGVYDRLRAGKRASPFPKNPRAEQAAEDAFRRGEVGSVDDVKRIMQGAAAPQAPAPQEAPAPTPAPEAPTLELAPERDPRVADEAPEGMTRAELGRAKGGKGAIVRAFDEGGRVIDQRHFATAKDAELTLQAWKKAAAAGRREGHATKLTPTEEQVATSAPGAVPWPTAESLEIAQDWYDNGKQGPTPALYRSLRAARQLGTTVHQGWLEKFPDLKDVEATGRRKRGAGPAAPVTRPFVPEPQSFGGIGPDTAIIDRKGWKIFKKGEGVFHLVSPEGKSTEWPTFQAADDMLKDLEASRTPEAKQRAYEEDKKAGDAIRGAEGAEKPNDYGLDALKAAAEGRPQGPPVSSRAKPALAPAPKATGVRASTTPVFADEAAAATVVEIRKREVKKPTGEAGGGGAAAPGTRDHWVLEAIDGDGDVAYQTTVKTKKEADELENSWLRREGLLPGAGAAAPPADLTKVEPFDPLDRLGGKAYEGVVTAIERAPEALRAELRAQAGQAVLRLEAVETAQSDVDFFKAGVDSTGKPIPNKAKKYTAARQNLQSAKALYEGVLTTLRGVLKDEKEGAKIVARIDQLLHGKGIRLEPEPRVELPLARTTIANIEQWALETADMEPGEAIDTVAEYAKVIAADPLLAVPHEDVLEHLESVAGIIDSLGQARLDAYFDLPGLGRKKIAAAIAAGPDDPNWAKVVDYATRRMNEWRAFQELVYERGEPTGGEPELRRVADNLADDLAAEPETEDESYLDRTFMAGLKWPWGGVLSTLEAINAIREGRGRLYARILQAYYDASKAASFGTGEVPFDIPDGTGGTDIQEAPRDKFGQVLIPGMLEAVMSTPQKPTSREGKPAADFTDSPLFNQEKDAKTRAEEEKNKKAQGMLFSPSDTFGGRYGPPPRKPTAEQQAAREKWAEKLRAMMKGGIGGGLRIPDSGAPGAPGEVEGQEPAPALRPERGGAGAPVEAGAAGGTVGGGRGRSVHAGVPGGGARPREATAGAARRGVFQIVNPREEATFRKEPKYDLIPERLRGVDANGDALLSPEQKVGVAKAVEALQAGVGFLWQDGTGVGKTREILATAESFRAAGNKVLIVSKASAIEAVKRDGVYYVTGSFETDSKALGVDIEFKRAIRPMQKGKIYVSTYHNLRDQPVDKDTVLIFDESHQLKNAGDSEVAQAGIAAIRQAKVTAFASATPGDKPYHMVYLTSIGLLEGKPLDQWMKDMGCVAVPRKVFSKKLYKRYLGDGLKPDAAKEKATEEMLVWRSTSSRKTNRATEGLFERLTEKGTVIKREVDMSGLEVFLTTVPVTNEMLRKIDVIASGPFDRKNMLMHMRRQLEPEKLAYTQQLIGQELDAGRSVVVFAARVNESKVEENIYGPDGEIVGRRTLMESEGTLKTLREWLKSEGIDYAEIHGAAEETTERAQKRFQANAARVVIATYEKGGTGINLDDRTGLAPRTMVMMTSPFDANSVVQGIGRIHRFTTMSNGRIHILFSPHLVDQWNAAIVGTKIKQLHAMVSGDIALLDPELLMGGEEALQAGGEAHYRDVRLALMGHAPMGERTDLGTAKHFGALVHWLKRNKVKMTLKGGDFEIPTLEGFVIEGKLEKAASSAGWSGWDHFLTWNDDPEAGDLIQHIRAAPPKLGRREQAQASDNETYSKLVSFTPQGSIKQMVTKSQYEFFRDTLNKFGAVWGWDGKPGNFSLITKEGAVYAGELVPAKLWNNFGRAARGEEGAFRWGRTDPGETQESRRSTYITQIDVDMTDLLRRVKAGEEYKDFYERHENVLVQLFGNDAELFKRLLSVTSQANSVDGNVTLAVKAYEQMRTGKPFRGYLPTVRAALRSIAKNELGYARGPKISKYDDASLERDINAIAVDRHVARFILGRENLRGGATPNAKQVAFITKTLMDAAKLLGWTGREIHAAAWAAQQIEEGLDPKEVKTYDQLLKAKARAIHRFRSYFGDVGVQRGWVHAPLRSAAYSEKPGGGPIDPGAQEAGVGGPDVSRIVTVLRPYLRWAKPKRKGLALPGPGTLTRLRDGEVYLGTVLAKSLHYTGRIDWNGLSVRYLEDLVALGGVARSTSVEHGNKLFFSNGFVVDSLQVTSLSPVSLTWGGQASMDGEIVAMLAKLRAAGHKDVKMVDLHNHPSGDPAPSHADMRHAEYLAKTYPEYAGAVIINHEQGSTIERDGTIKRIRRAATFIDPDPLLQAGVDANAYWGNAAYGNDTYKGPYLVGTASALADLGKAVMDKNWMGTPSASPLLVLVDGRGRLRALTIIPKPVFVNPGNFTTRFATLAQIHGATAAYVVWEGNDRDVAAAATDYMNMGLISEGLMLGPDPQGGDPRVLASVSALNLHMNGISYPNGHDGIDWRNILTDPATGSQQIIMQARSSSPFSAPGAGSGGGGGNRGGFGGGGDEPPRPPDRPSDGRMPDDPDEPWWVRRVRFARERTRSRLAQANAFIDPRAAWDFVVLGADAFARGAKSFLRWIGAMVRDIPNIGHWGRSLYDYVRTLFAPRITETRGRPEAFDDAAAATGVRPRGPIRPIPNVRRADIDAAARRATEGPPGDPRSGRPRGVGGTGDLAININQISDENGIRQLFATIVRSLEGRFSQARMKLTEAEMRREANLSGLTDADIARLIREKGALNYTEIIAARMLRQEAGIDFTNKFQAWEDAKAAHAAETNPVRQAGLDVTRLEMEREMRASLQKLIGIMYSTAAAGSEAGRALYAHKLFIESLSPEERFLRRMLRGTSPSEKLVADLAAAIQRGDMMEVNRLTRQLHRPGLWRTVNEYFINSVLSGPATLGANIMGNLVHEAMRGTERGVAGRLEQFGIRQGIERILTGSASPKERFVGEAAQAIKAQVYYKFGLPSALKLMWEATWKESPEFMTGVKGEFHPPAIPGVLGKVIRTPGRWMQALDLGAKYSASRGERVAQIFRRVTKEAFEQGGMTREEFNRRMGEVGTELTRFVELETNRVAGELPSNADYSWMARNRHYADMYKEMQRAALESTFQDDTTKFTRYLQSMRNSYPWLTLIIPFIKTPERILVQAVRRTPVGLAKSLYNIKTGKISGGLATDRLAQGMLGSAVMAGIYMLAKDGLITGGGPPDPEERRNWLKTGKQPYAIRVGKEWISLARIEPLATTLGMAADLAQASDEKIAGDFADKLHASIVNNITNKTYLEGIVSFAEAMGDPDRYGAQVWKRLIGAAVPNMLASAARAIDPTIRQTDSIKDTLMSRVPILSESVPAKLTGTGEPVKRGETALSRFASPFRYSPEAGPEANLERLFLETGYNPSTPPKSVSIPGGKGRRVELTQQERRLYGEYVRRATAFARTLAKDKDWSGLDVYAKEEVLKRIYRFAHDAGRRELYRSIFARSRKEPLKVMAP